MPSMQEMWDGWPSVTKHIGVFSFLMTAAASFKLIDIYQLILYFPKIFSSDIELWRLVTSPFFFGPFGMNFLFSFMIFLQYSSFLENDRFSGRVADFIYCFIVGLIPMFLIAFLIQNYQAIYMLGSCMMMYLVYIYCNFNPDSSMKLMFVPVDIPSRYFPFALAALHIVLGGGADSLVEDGIGILCGHIYYFLEEKYPQEYGTRILTTPSFLYWLFPPTNLQQVHGVAPQQFNARGQPQQPQGRGGFPGQGRRLQ